ncbi:MAG: replication initiator [Streptosporangiaceae bacterium]
MLGYGGHFLTKSRRYSVTFGQLRAARTDHRRQERHPDGERDPWGRPLDETVVLILTTWTYAGTGYASTPDADPAGQKSPKGPAYTACDTTLHALDPPRCGSQARSACPGPLNAHDHA